VKLLAVALVLASIQPAPTGRLVLHVDPLEARVEIDGQDVPDASGRAIELAPGPHVVRVSHPAFAAQEFEVEVSSAGETTVGVRLSSVGRDLVVRSEPGEVDVRLDGLAVGRTARPPGDVDAPAELRIEGVAAGEHVLELERPCFRGERRELSVAVDLLDPRPQLLGVVRLAAAQATISVYGEPAGAEVLVDGLPAGHLPVERFAVCPGMRRVETRAHDRTAWASSEVVPDGEAHVVTVMPRPNVAWLDGGPWPAALAAWAGTVNRIDVDRPAGFDPSVAGGWLAAWDPQFDLLLAADAAGGAWVHSPHLATEVRLDAASDVASLGRPAWVRPSFGLLAADLDGGGPRAVVAVVAPGGPAAGAGLLPGDRIVAAGGEAIADTAALRRALAAATPDAPLSIEWLDPAGGRHASSLRAGSTPVLDAGPARGTWAALLRAAWAACDAAAGGAESSLALANLALAVSAHGRPERAAEIWKRVRLPERAGIGPGTVQYLLGRDLARLGRRAEALRAFELAAASPATALDDAGPPVAPAARDCLRDLAPR